jgi:histidine ammonia-lyase
MRGIPWSEAEKMLLIFFNIRGTQHEEIRQKLLRRKGINRTVAAIRSQLSELREDRTLHDPVERVWDKTELEQRIQHLSEVDQYLFVSIA